MRLLSALLLFTILGNGLLAKDANKTNCIDYPAQIDSMYYLKWDGNNNIWSTEYIRHYKYYDAELMSLQLLDGISRDSVWLWRYYYNSDNNRDYELLVKWDDSISCLSQKKESEFINGLKINQLTYNWKNGEWVINTNSIFEYSENRLLKEVVQFRDITESFYDIKYINYAYDNGLIQKVTVQRASDGATTEIRQYTYNSDNQLQEILIHKMVENSSLENPEYQPFARRTYFYSEFNLQSEVLFETWENNSWIPSAKYIYFRKIDYAKKVTICHNGNILCVSINALEAHLAHGDNLGLSTYDECQSRNMNRGEIENSYGIDIKNNEINNIREIPFKVFPNPVKERLTVRFNVNEYDDFDRVELLDVFGKILISQRVKGAGDIIIPRGILKSGNYYIRVIGEEVYSTMVIFK